MADHSTPHHLPMLADAPSRPLLSALTRFWSPVAAPAADPELGYESALPWVLDDTPGDSAGHLHY